MIQNRTCQQCNITFQGGPHAYFCSDCRVQRQRERSNAFKRRKRAGDIRLHGSIDECERCGNKYTVNASAQRFCADCQLAHRLEHDAARAMPKYTANKEQLNPVRNERRQVGLIACAWCGCDFDPMATRRGTCSDECAREHKNKRWRNMYYKQKIALNPEG